MTDIVRSLAAHLHRTGAPFLFIGSGLSRRYTGADDWEGLLRHFAEMTDRPYEYYKTSAGGDLPAVASKIADSFHDLWWSEAEFEDSRQAYVATGLRDRESALKVEVARYVEDLPASLPESGPLAEEVELLSRAVVDGVITTNFDPILETLFPEFRVFVGQDELMFANPQGIGEIYKIHGSCSDPDSLVLTAEDYQRFDQRNAYLASKLMTIFVEHPVVFLGYSLGDRNVTSILRAIAACLRQDNVDQLRDRLVFVRWDNDSPSSISPHTVMVDGFVIPVIEVVVPDFIEVFTVLASLRRTFPAQLLRRLKEHVYELVLTDDPHEQLFVAEIGDDTRAQDIDVVFGVGVGAQLGEHGYVGIDRWDLIKDVLDGSRRYRASAVVAESLPRILAQPGNVPVFKYLRQSGALDPNGDIRTEASVPTKVAAMAARIRAGMPASSAHKRKAPEVLASVHGVADLERQLGEKNVLGYGTCMTADMVDPAELLDFLQRHRHYLTEKSWENTQYVKLVCLYDWAVYGLNSSPTDAAAAPEPAEATQ